MELKLLDEFETSLQTFLDSVVNDMTDKKSSNADSILDIWHKHNTKITSKVIQLMFKLVESHGINQNSIKDSERSLHSEILSVWDQKATNMVDKIFKDKIKPIIYQSLTQWKS